MSSNLLFLLVEGSDDERFAQAVLEKPFLKKYHAVKIISFAQRPKKYVDGLIRSAKSMSADYVLLTDINSSPCVTHRKTKISEKFRLCDFDKIQVVAPEIESWYVAGLDTHSIDNLKIARFDSVNLITKEIFDSITPPKMHRRDFLIEVLKHFSLDTAKANSTSFQYFCTKHNL